VGSPGERQHIEPEPVEVLRTVVAPGDQFTVELHPATHSAS
jgi:hypothetical protein